MCVGTPKNWNRKLSQGQIRKRMGVCCKRVARNNCWKKKYWFYISSSGSRLLNHHSTLDGWGKDIFVKEYTCEYNKEKADILRMGKRTFHLVMYLVYGLTLYFIWHFMYIFVLCAGGLITICATIYCFDNELQEQLLTAYGFLCLYCLYKVS